MKLNTCLICATSGVAGDTQDENLLARHLVTAAQDNAEQITETSWVCNGSGFPPAQGGDIDATRRYAIQKYRLYDQQAVALKQKLVDALTAHDWYTAAAVQHFGDITALNEEIALYWSRAGRTTSLLEVVRIALSNLMPSTGGSAPLERAFEEIRASAARQFMVEVRREVERSYPKGLTADETALILFDI